MITFAIVLKWQSSIKKKTTFDYRQVMEQKTCLKLSMLWLITITYSKKLMIYIKIHNCFFKKLFVDVVAPLN